MVPRRLPSVWLRPEDWCPHTCGVPSLRLGRLAGLGEASRVGRLTASVSPRRASPHPGHSGSVAVPHRTCWRLAPHPRGSALSDSSASQVGPRAPHSAQLPPPPRLLHEGARQGPRSSPGFPRLRRLPLLPAPWFQKWPRAEAEDERETTAPPCQHRGPGRRWPAPERGRFAGFVQVRGSLGQEVNPVAVTPSRPDVDAEHGPGSGPRPCRLAGSVA